jgi:hypothetical protein
VIDDVVGAKFAGFGELFVRTRRRDYAGAEKFGDLDGGDADAAPCAEDENIFAGLQFSTSQQHVPRGLEDQRDGGCFFEGQILGVREAIHFRCANEFGATAVDHITEVGELTATIVEARKARGAFAAGDARGEDHSLADACGGDLSADLGNLACDVAAWYMRDRDRNAGDALAYPEIETIESASADAYENFIGAHHRVGNVRIFQDFGAAVLLELDGLHFWPPGFLVPSRPVRTVPARNAPQSQGKLTYNLPRAGVR